MPAKVYGLSVVLSVESTVSLTETHEHRNSQLYPLRAKYRGVRESEFFSFESAALDFDLALIEEFADNVDSDLASKLDSLDQGGTSADITYYNSYYNQHNPPGSGPSPSYDPVESRTLSWSGLVDLHRRLDALDVKVSILIENSK